MGTVVAGKQLEVEEVSFQHKEVAGVGAVLYKGAVGVVLYKEVVNAPGVVVVVMNRHKAAEVMVEAVNYSSMGPVEVGKTRAGEVGMNLEAEEVVNVRNRVGLVMVEVGEKSKLVVEVTVEVGGLSKLVGAVTVVVGSKLVGAVTVEGSKLVGVVTAEVEGSKPVGAAKAEEESKLVGAVKVKVEVASKQVAEVKVEVGEQNKLVVKVMVVGEVVVVVVAAGAVQKKHN